MREQTKRKLSVPDLEGLTADDASIFLELNGYSFVATEEAAAQAVLLLAAGDIDELGYGEFLRANSRGSPSRR